MQAYLAEKYLSGPKADAILARAGISKRKKKRKAGEAVVSEHGYNVQDDDGGWGAAGGDEPDEEAELVVASDRSFKKRKAGESWETIRPAANDATREDPVPADEQPVVVQTESEVPMGGLLTAEQMRKKFGPKEAEKVEKTELTEETVYRDSSGRKIDPKVARAEAARLKREQEEKEARKMEWGKGLIQREEENKRRVELEKERTRDVARYAHDKDLNEELKARERWNDPAAAFITKKSAKGPKRPTYNGPPPPPNRFGIKPGYRWDGVVVSMPTPTNHKQQLKQRTLTSFFNKSSGTPANTKTPRKAAAPNSLTPPIATGIAVTSEANGEKNENENILQQFGGLTDQELANFQSSPVKSTPPTSDPINVDMLFEVSDEETPIRKNTTKRKNIIIDSDDEPAQRDVDVRASYKGSKKSTGHAPKRLRTSSPGVDTDTPSSNAADFSSKLRASSASIHSETEVTVSVRKGRSRSASSSSSRRTSTDNDDFVIDEDEDSEADHMEQNSESELESKRQKSKYKSGGVSKPPKLKKGATVSDGLHDFHLTAAEQRTRDKKTDKIGKEEPFSFLLNIRDVRCFKDRKQPGDPDYDPTTLYIPPSAWKTFTPFEKQFWELYEDDARIGNRVFDLKLTQRVKMSMVGVPEMSFNFWAAKFLAKGYKIGRVDQAETALGAEMRRTADKGKSSGDKLVRRELNKVYTNGTLVDGDLLVDDEAGHCISVYEDSENNSYGICVLDSATSQFDLCAFTDDVCRTKLETVMRQLRPKEIVYTKGNLTVSTTRLLKTILNGTCLWTALRPSEGFKFDETLSQLREMFSEKDHMDENNGIPEAIRDMMGDSNVIVALGSMMWYLRRLNVADDILSMKNFNIYDPMKAGKGLILDGKRLFRLWLCMPLRDIKQIRARQNALQDFIDHPTLETEFSKLAKGVPDLERIVSRIHARNCKVREFLKVLEKLNKGFEGLGELADSISSDSIRGLLRTAPDLTSHIANIESMFEKPENVNVDELVPCEGKDDIYDRIQADIKELEDDLESRLAVIQKKLGVSLKFWHSAQGTKVTSSIVVLIDVYDKTHLFQEIYQVEAGTNLANKMPKSWSQTGSTKSVKRYSVPELEPLIRKLKEGREKKNAAAKEFKYRLYQEFDVDRSVWLRAVRVMAELDCLLSLAKSSVALGEPVCRPEFIEADFAFIDFEELRHPALCVKNDFIPNDVQLGNQVGRIALLTGPNMAGKSTVMRMSAAGVIMAQLGMLVPAKRARLVPLDFILTRMGAYDNMFGNASTFKVELDECCKILRDATPKSLVILDELGRGTSTYDGMAIAGAVLHHLATHTLPLSFFATHYSSLTDDFANHPNIRNMHMQTFVDDEKKELVFLYKLIDGVATGSFGTHVANLAGVPSEVVFRAEAISKDFAQKFKEKLSKKVDTGLSLTLQADFAFLWKLANGQVHPNDSTTNTTLDILRKLIKNQIM
ncbi:hypothetical protein Clacol_009163 [Clathrus columnatus]|uniref:DNA mismatch repair proteins mutS family domain-containing protein n=1 Tax=Clathrus columnatus TaxID=1419009 RepID=A0AAV5AQD1_9AGAM|nr:hypothetical protein Clacol_009163 [Clathrus columnatus]